MTLQLINQVSISSVGTVVVGSATAMRTATRPWSPKRWATRSVIRWCPAPPASGAAWQRRQSGGQIELVGFADELQHAVKISPFDRRTSATISSEVRYSSSDSNMTSVSRRRRSERYCVARTLSSSVNSTVSNQSPSSSASNELGRIFRELDHGYLRQRLSDVLPLRRVIVDEHETVEP